MDSVYEIYRKSSLGVALEDTLDELVVNGVIDPGTANYIFTQYDIAFAEAMNSESFKGKAHIRGDIDTYRFCDEVWTFDLRNVTVRAENDQYVKADALRVVAVAYKSGAATSKGSATASSN